MTSSSEHFEMNTDGLDRLNKIVEEGQGMYLKVGVLGDYAGRTPDENGPGRKNSDLMNPLVGLWHEFGTFQHNSGRHTKEGGQFRVGVPERSWLRMPLFSKLPAEVERIGSGDSWLALLMSRGIFGVLDVVGNAAIGVISDAFHTGGFGTWAPLARSTVRRKKSSEILIESGQLQRAVTYAVVRSGSPMEAVS